MPYDEIIIYGADWCSDCRRTKSFLKQHQIVYTWIDIDKDKNAELYVKKLNKGQCPIPTIIFKDGTILVEPTNQELAEKLELTSQT